MIFNDFYNFLHPTTMKNKSRRLCRSSRKPTDTDMRAGECGDPLWFSGGTLLGVEKCMRENILLLPGFPVSVRQKSRTQLDADITLGASTIKSRFAA